MKMPNFYIKWRSNLKYGHYNAIKWGEIPKEDGKMIKPALDPPQKGCKGRAGVVY